MIDSAEFSAAPLLFRLATGSSPRRSYTRRRDWRDCGSLSGQGRETCYDRAPNCHAREHHAPDRSRTGTAVFLRPGDGFRAASEPCRMSGKLDASLTTWHSALADGSHRVFSALPAILSFQRHRTDNALWQTGPTCGSGLDIPLPSSRRNFGFRKGFWDHSPPPAFAVFPLSTYLSAVSSQSRAAPPTHHLHRCHLCGAASTVAFARDSNGSESLSSRLGARHAVPIAVITLHREEPAV